MSVPKRFGDPNPCRSPHGERGLKLLRLFLMGRKLKSLPTRGAWIEIIVVACLVAVLEVAPHTGSVD